MHDTSKIIIPINNSSSSLYNYVKFGGGTALKLS